jgi:hypothetical protein
LPVFALDFARFYKKVLKIKLNRNHFEVRMAGLSLLLDLRSLREMKSGKTVIEFEGILK